MFPIQAKSMKKMLNDLGLLSDVIGLNVKGTVGSYNKEEKKLYPVKEGKKLHCEVNVYNVVPMSFCAMFAVDGSGHWPISKTIIFIHISFVFTSLMSITTLRSKSCFNSA
jgi:hypothetical protein